MSYTNSSIKVLKGIKAVRQNPSMYIGSTDITGYHQLVWEIVDNALDEYLAGFANSLRITITANEELIIEDNGRGIPTGINHSTQLSTIETVFSVLHASGKFDDQTYQVSGGLHGVGSTVTNALSKFLEVKVYKNQKVYQLKFENGFKTTENLVIKPTDRPDFPSGTVIHFKPDNTLFDEKYILDHDIIKNRLEQSAYINENLRIEFTDERNNFHQIYQFKDGLQLLLKKLIGKELLVNKLPISGHFTIDKIQVRYLFRYIETNTQTIYSFCNNINTYEGGTHEQGLKMGIARVIKKMMKDHRYLNNDKEKLETEDTISGLVAIISVLHPNPKFYGQTKTKLVNKNVASLIYNQITKSFEKILLENPTERDKICEKVLRALRLRNEINKKTIEINRVKLFENSPLPGKLADCSTSDRESSELFIVEGDSAGGSAKLGRDRHFQAILPLKGKIINSERSPIYKLFKNEEILDLIISFGYQITNTGIVCKEHGLKNCVECADKNQAQLRYGKIIIMTDADVDGAHISVLLLTFFYRHLPWLLEAKRVFLAQPPLYKFQIGKKVQYLYSESELKRLQTLNRDQKYNIQRYKGLGEMNPDQLWETTMNPAKRVLKQVTIFDGQNANESITTLMGKEVEPRKEFIVKNANFAINLDI